MEGESSTPAATVVEPQPGSAGLLPRVIRIGRSKDNTVVLSYPFVSSHHARVTIVGERAVLEDLGSRNGTAVNAPANRITVTDLRATDTVYFGTLPVPAARLLGEGLVQGDAPVRELALERSTLILGRSPECDLVLPSPSVSRQHARLRRRAGVTRIEDLGSTNGTFINGRRISGPTVLAAGDLVGIGGHLLRLASDELLVENSWRGNLTVEVRSVTVTGAGRNLLEDVSLTAFPSELIGVMGPSGAGKTTLLSALNGYARPASGQVLFNGIDLYTNYDLFRLHVGYVPQDDIMHRDLTVRQALYYSARLRLPADTSDAELHARIDAVLADLGLVGLDERRIGTPERKGISGGERKRVNIAMELLTDPSVLFLDEPTSGLSSQDALTVVQVLRRLADEGKTVILTIHQPSREAFELLDEVVVVGKDEPEAPGLLAYFGPAHPDAARFFALVDGGEHADDAGPDCMLRAMYTAKASRWAARFQHSEVKRQYVDGRAGTRSAVAQAPPPRSVRRPGFRQWWTLARRAAAVKVGDLDNLVMLVIQAPVIAAFTVLVFGPQTRQDLTWESWPAVAGSLSATMFMLSVAAVWLGCSNAAREIVAEWAVYHRERMVNLRIPSYVVSKLLVLGGVGATQCAILAVVTTWGCGLAAPVLATFGVLFLVSLVGLGCGLVLSAYARTSEVAISLVPTVLLPMIMLGGALAPLPEMSRPIRAVAQVMPTRWSFEGLVLLESARRPHWQAVQAINPAAPLEGAKPQEGVAEKSVADVYFPASVRAGLNASIGVLAAMAVLLVAAIAVILRTRDVL